jgi:hypothetical protein
MTLLRTGWGGGAAGLVCIVVALAGCGAGSAEPHVAAVPVPTPSSMAQLALPVAAYELTDQQSAEEQYLELRLAQVCMSRAGFRYLPGLSAGSIAEDVRIEREFDSRRYGVSDLAVVARYGYHLPAWVTGPGISGSPGSLPRAERAALVGTGVTGGSSAAAAGSHSRASGPPPGGCLGWSDSQLAAAGVNVEDSSASPLAAQIQQQGFEQAQSDPRVRAVFAAWSACMRVLGYRYATPFAAAEDPRWNMAVPASPGEIATAKADVACKMRVNVLGVEFAVESDYENAAIAANAGPLAQAKAEDASQVRGLSRLLDKYLN